MTPCPGGHVTVTLQGPGSLAAQCPTLRLPDNTLAAVVPASGMWLFGVPLPILHPAAGGLGQMGREKDPA